MQEIWCLWETMGDSAGMSRGRMRDAMVAARPPGWELVAALATVGSSGWWPHSMGLWRLDAAALTEALSRGWDDGLDETSFRWGASRLLERTRGALDASHEALLLESFRAETAAAVDALVAPDLVLRELLAPWQGVAVWGARDLFALAERQRAGIGVAGVPGMLDVEASWAIVTPERELV